MLVCENCPMRLFNTKNYNLKGIGNPHYGICIVIPNVDYQAYKKGSIGFSKQVEIIKDIISSSSSSTGELDLFIVPLIRCNETISCELTDDIYYRCITHFANDIYKYNFKYIMLLGDAGRKFLNVSIKDNLDNIFISSHNRCYIVNYSPLVKYIDDTKFEDFKSHLLKWYNSIRSKYFTNYNFIKL